MPTYQILFTDNKGFMLAEDEFVAAHDGAATLIAKWLFEACSDLYANYVLLWRAGRRFKHLPKVSPTAGTKTINRETIRIAQEIALERELVLRDSRSRLAASQRFLQENSKLSQLLGPPRAGAAERESSLPGSSPTSLPSSP